MKLTLHTHHSLTVLAHLAACPDRLSSIREMAQSYGISHNHLMKIVHELRGAGFVAAVRGRRGGIRLARPAREITLRELVRHTEKPFRPYDGAAPANGQSRAATDMFEAAFTSFFATLSGFTVADLTEREVCDRSPGKKPQV